MNSAESAYDQAENRPGLKCRLIDISEDGAAILVGGRAKVGITVKLQFALASEQLMMVGIVKGIEFKQNKNQSVLHIQAVNVPTRIKNQILSYVYNLFGERGRPAGKLGTVAT